jgi:hypothetical protein
MTAHVLTPQRLVEWARQVVEVPEPVTVGLWSRAASLLGRQALEETVDAFWRKTEPAMEHVSTRAQFLCLSQYLPDPALARDMNAAWLAFTHACHYHPYELPPTSGELLAWLETIDRMTKSVGPPEEP